MSSPSSVSPIVAMYLGHGLVPWSSSVSQNESSGLSLLSLSAVAASAMPIPTKPTQAHELSIGGGSSYSGTTQLSGVGLGKHRRLSSTGKAKRRLSDARDAAIRPSATSLQTAATALATLSLSASPPHHAQGSTGFSSFRAASAIPIPPKRESDASPDPRAQSTSQSVPSDDGIDGADDASQADVTKGGKKRGTIFTCESCSKVYRHPSCLIKHRWEHAPQWREASKFVLSKHQQVQLLEAAAILSHLAPSSAGGTGTSLPEDRSLWPSFLSGGTLPPPVGVAMPTPRISSSVPSRGAGPRMHEYPVGGGGLTQLRPGVLGVPTGSGSSSPMPVPRSLSPSRSQAQWPSQSSSSSYPHSTYAPHSSGISHSHGISYTHSHSYSDGAGGWSLPPSSLRSVSMSRSSASPDSPSSDEPAEIDDGVGAYPRYTGRWGMGLKREDDEMSLGFSMREEDEDGVEEDMVLRKKAKESEEVWDGMDMDMLMD